VKLGDREVERFLKKPDPALRAALFYGADLGLIRERAKVLARTVLADLADPFRVVELVAKSVRDDPARLSDEAAAIAFTGGRKVVWLREAGDGVADAVRSLFAQAGWDALVLVEAPELAKRSKLVELFEGEAGAVAIGCYLDGDEAIERVVEETLARHGLDIAPDALAFLSEHLGGDRGMTRAEAEKLALYCLGQKSVSRADAAAVIGDSAASGLDDAIHGAFDGDAARLARALARLREEGVSPVTLLLMSQRHVQRLQLVASGVSVRALRPPAYFAAAAGLERQARSWSAALIARALALLTEADLRCRSTGAPANAIAGQALHAIAGMARRGVR
jgi:DNA polymerase-3 subunit delta